MWRLNIDVDENFWDVPSETTRFHRPRTSLKSALRAQAVTDVLSIW
jgi:hypothetical protein